VVAVATDEFIQLARMISSASGLRDLRIAVIPHPLGGLKPAEARTRGVVVARAVLSALGMQEEETTGEPDH